MNIFKKILGVPETRTLSEWKKTEEAKIFKIAKKYGITKGVIRRIKLNGGIPSQLLGKKAGYKVQFDGENFKEMCEYQANPTP